MDDKTLHDILIDGDFNLSNYEPEDCGDAIAAWTDAINIETHLLKEIFMDAMEELVIPSKEDEYGIMANRRNSMFSDIALAYIAFMNMDSRSSSAYVTSSKARRYSSRCLDVGEAVVLSVHEWVTDYVEENGSQWFIDVLGYHADMEEGQREDAAMFRADR
jgi:hypothetical protein